MTEKKKTSKSGGTLTRCTKHAQTEVNALSKRLYEAYEKEHNQLGIKRPSAKVAIDALLYWAAMSGVLKGKKVTDKNNIYCAIKTISEELQNV